MPETEIADLLQETDQMPLHCHHQTQIHRAVLQHIDGLVSSALQAVDQTVGQLREKGGIGDHGQIIVGAGKSGDKQLPQQDGHRQPHRGGDIGKPDGQQLPAVVAAVGYPGGEHLAGRADVIQPLHVQIAGGGDPDVRRQAVQLQPRNAAEAPGALLLLQRRQNVLPQLTVVPAAGEVVGGPADQHAPLPAHRQDLVILA